MGQDHAILDRLLEGCQIIDRSYAYAYVNDVVVAQSRLTREELVGRKMLDCYPGIDATPMFASLRACMESGVPGQMENEFSFPDGARIVYDLRFIPVAEGVCILSLDITERRNALASIVDGAGDAIIGFTLAGIITSWNGGATKMLGWQASETIGQSVLRFVPPRSAEYRDARARELDASGRTGEAEATLTTKDGHAIDVWARLSPIRDAQGTLVGTATVLRDVTELKRAQRDLTRTRDDLEASNRELASFSHSVAHDLRAPLRGIDGFSQALLEDYGGQLDAVGRQYIDRVRDAAQMMGQLIDDMLRLSRVTRAELRHESIDVSAMAASILARHAKLEPDRSVVVSIEPALRCIGDTPLISALLENLLANAWKFTRKRSPGHISVGAIDGGGVPTFFVRDDGAGFDMQYADKLFGVFQRLHSSTDFEGTGVGLATVQRIAMKHGGRAWAEGVVDGGACFYFTLAPSDARARTP